MDEKTAAALEESIAKWKRNARVRDIENAKIYGDSCALCKLFPGCGECPVFVFTGYTDCQYTPWRAVFNAYHGNDLEVFRKAVLAEVAFLESLREPKE